MPWRRGGRGPAAGRSSSTSSAGRPRPALEVPTPRDEIRAALAGPLVSLVLGAGLVAIALACSAIGGDVVRAIGEICLVVGVLNLVLGGVNLLPAFPLDGGRVIRAVGWGRTGDAAAGLRLSGRAGRWLGIALAALGVVMILTMDSIDGLMLALCGWFLVSSARAIERSAVVDDLLRGLHVRDVMERDVRGVPAAMTLDTFAEQILEMPGRSIPVVDGPDLVGVLGEREVRRVRRSRWASTRARDLMTAAAGLPAIDPSMSLRAARDLLFRTGLDGLPVLESGALAGIVTRRGVAQAIHDEATRSAASGPA